MAVKSHHRVGRSRFSQTTQHGAAAVVSLLYYLNSCIIKRERPKLVLRGVADKFIITCAEQMNSCTFIFLYDDNKLRRIVLCEVSPDSSVHILLPPQQYPSILTRLRSPSKFPRLPTRTKKISVLHLLCPQSLKRQYSKHVFQNRFYFCLYVYCFLYTSYCTLSYFISVICIFLYICIYSAIKATNLNKHVS